MYREPSALERGKRIVVALARLWRARKRLVHVPTVRQVRWMAGFDGHDPRSYLLDRTVNWMPEMLPERMERQFGRHGLLLTKDHPNLPGTTFELVVFPDGWGFDLT